MARVLVMDLANPPGSISILEDRSGVSEVKDGEKVEGKSEGEMKSKGQAWVDVAQDKKSLKKYEVEVTTKDGKHKVEIPEDVFTGSTPLWDDIVVGKFLDLAPHIAKVHMVLNKIWSYGDTSTKIEVYEVNATTMRFRISNPKAREKVLKRGMWNIAGVPMVVSKWAPKTEEEKQEETVIPMWVHLRNVPLHMYSWEGLSFFTSTVGYPVRLHPETIACTNLEVAKVFVNVDVSKELPKEIEFSKDGKDFTVAYHYPWLPAWCSICDKWGHTDKVCVKGSRKKQNGGVAKGGNGRKEDHTESSNQVGDEKTGGQEMSARKVNGSSDDERTKKKEGKDQEVAVVKEMADTNAWLRVSPARVGRSQTNTPRREAEIHISDSKYSVLGV